MLQATCGRCKLQSLAVILIVQQTKNEVSHEAVTTTHSIYDIRDVIINGLEWLLFVTETDPFY